MIFGEYMNLKLILNLKNKIWDMNSINAEPFG